jgi:hypothetical protein
MSNARLLIVALALLAVALFVVNAVIGLFLHASEIMK